ncbi:hypothetical protein NEMIN01_2297 [Nematocida minor]|uniref:uncharacterized protein n=1 Tax=Nematocida minor TaxID=1912983 RepID=UPI00221F6567|nr:uncharacterized protein NEMIN01_2297 [Nematocida minor]KAI5192933.1 hypothetical protein NEMIN01_2297 [Nematocida minor]
MDSEHKRSAIVSEEDYSEKPAGYVPRDSASYQSKKPQYRISTQARTDPKKVDMDKKKKKKREDLDAKPEKAEPQIIIPAKRERKGFQLMFVDGSELTETVVKEELKKHHIITDTPASEEAKEKEDTEVAASERESEGKAGISKAHGEHTEGAKGDSAVSSEQSLKAAEKESTPEQKEEPAAKAPKPEEPVVAPINYEIVNGVPTGTDPTTGEKRAAWSTDAMSMMRANLFQSSKPPITSSSRASAQSPRIKKKIAEKSVEKTAEKTEKEAASKLVKDIQKMKIKTADAPLEKVEEKRALPSEVPEMAPVEEVDVKSSEKSQPEALETVSQQAEESPSTLLFKSLEHEEIVALPIVYSKEQLMSYKKFSDSILTTIDKSIFNKSAMFSKKKKEFKTFKMGSFKDPKKSAPVTVFASIEPYVAEFNLALNQVCQNNIEEVAKRILAIKVPTEEAMIELSTAFFNRAMQEQAYTAIYAALAEMIQKKFRSATEDSYDEEKYEKDKEKDANKERKPRSRLSVFGKTLAMLSKNEFESQRSWASDQSEQKAVSMSAEKLAERVMEISSNKEKEYERMNVKKKAITIVRFLIELYLQGFFTDTIMHSATDYLTEADTPENVEKMCYILKHAGKRLDQEVNREHVDKYMCWLERVSEGLSSRYRFMVEDIRELRENNWCPKDARKASVSDDEDGWKSSKTKEKKKFVKEKERAKKDIKPQKVSEMIESQEDEYRRMESAVVSTLKKAKDLFSAAEQARRLAAEQGSNAMFFAALIKITIEGYGDTLSNGMELVKEWIRVSPVALQKKDEVFEYIDEMMPDLVDDSPNAPAHFEALKKIIHK